MASLIDLIRRATVAPIRRLATKPSYGSKLRRLDEKAHRGRIKQGRRGGGDGE
jgi:ribosome-associated protein